VIAPFGAHRSFAEKSNSASRRAHWQIGRCARRRYEALS
jgi:hypothetical protein